MKLKSLEIIGFKSFANRKKLFLPPGLTAIVGPNGCGKTNIIEAIRWVLGEQNARVLRGERMEEVIFNGTLQRKPLGMAEVTLTLADPERRMGLDTEEVVVGRRVYRSGESIYNINNTPCKLREILDLFMDTGMGSHAYSMIEQQMVEAVLSDRAEERRFLFEEAAGIMKYKVRRKYALRKLESTDSDLLRINDIVGEVERAVNSLTRQVRKARRYQSLIEKLRRVAVTLAARELEELESRENPLKARLGELTDSLALVMASESSEGARYEELRGRINDRELNAEELYSQLGLVNNQIRETEKTISVTREKRASGREWIADSQKRRQSLDERVVLRAGELEGYQRQVGQVRAAAARAEAEHRAADEALQGQVRTVTAAREQVRSVEALRRDLIGRSAAGESKAETLAESAENLKTRAEELRVRAAEIASRLEDTRMEHQDLLEKIELANEQHCQKAAAAAFTGQALEKAKSEVDKLAQDLARKKLRLESLESEHRMLERMQKDLEGFQEGVRSLILGQHRREGIEAVAAELFSTEPRYEKAVEAALGLRMQSIITRDTGAMLEAIRSLRSNGGGKATFISRDLVNSYRPEIEQIEGPVLAYCDEVVRCGQEYEFLRELLFKGIAIVEDLDTAIALQRRSARPLHVVTLTGEALCQYAVSSGMAASRDGSVGLMERKLKISQLARQIKETSSEIESLEQELAKAREGLEKLAGDNERNLEALAQAGKSVAGLEAENTRVKLELENLTSRKQLSEEESAEALVRADEMSAQRQDLLSSAAETRNRLTELETAEAEAGTLFQSQENQRERLAEAVQQVSLELAQQKARLGELENTCSLVERERAAAADEAARLSQEIEARQKQLILLDEQERSLRKDLDLAYGRRSGLVEAREKHEQELSELKTEAGAIERALREIRQEREIVTEHRHQAELELGKISSRRELVIQQVATEHQVDLNAVGDDFPFYPAPGDQKEGEEPVSAEMAENLRQRIRSLGPVNVLALEEYDQQKERLDFLKAQRADLVEARDSLLRLIDEINHTARERFLDSFGKIQANFQDIFSALFEGGQAHIQLVDELDPLESPIEVMARPRGKKMLSLGLLSGGEKALTALALLFAIYSVKPSPFCILDEVDAPLDDANIDRFLSIIRKFSEHTQFIMVTHNKRTMEAADCLYGVTMQEPGVSKIVSVRLDQVDEKGRISFQEKETANVG